MTTQDKTPGSAPERKNRFDEADRQRVRVTLFRYMEDHRIGVPTLIAHMAKVVKREARYIPQKTLQRFLEGRMRTNDAVVSIFHEFVQSLPPARDELADLSLALAGFFQLPDRDREVPAHPTSSLGDYIVDRDHLYTYPGPIEPRTNMRHRLPHGELRIDPKPAGTVLRMTELLRQRGAEASPKDLKDTARACGEYFEGVLVSFARFHVAVLRSTATRKPRIHWLTQTADAQLQSLCQFASIPNSQGGLLQIASEQLHVAIERAS